MSDSRLEDLDSTVGVPDGLYLALIDQCETDEQCAAASVLRFHRDWLNGGFGQVFDNLSGEPMEAYLNAYRTVGLSHVTPLIIEALAYWNNGNLSDQELDGLDALDDRYVHLTYGESGDEPDEIEKTLVQYAQANPSAFASAWRRTIPLM